jgi:hypothetical protein
VISNHTIKLGILILIAKLPRSALYTGQITAPWIRNKAFSRRFQGMKSNYSFNISGPRTQSANSFRLAYINQLASIDHFAADS